MAKNTGDMMKKYFWTFYLIAIVASGVFCFNVIAGPSVPSAPASLTSLGLDSNLADLTTAEVQQLENIGATTISAAQWTGLGGATTAGLAIWDGATSAEMLALISDETGTGKAVFGTAPTFVTSITMGSAGLTEPELEILDGATLSTTELNYNDGLTGTTGTGKQVRDTAPTFVTSITMGAAILVEAELEILDGATTTTTQLNYLNTATGTTGTNTTNLVYSESPTFTGTAIFATINIGTLVMDASATPQWVFRDSNNAGTDKEIAKIYANATTVTDGAEDGSMALQVMDSGSEKTFIFADGDTTAEYVQVGPTDSTYNMHIYHKIDTIVDRWSGDAIIMTVDSGVTSIFGQALHVDSDGELILADADVASAGAAPCIGLALEAGTGSKLILLRGFITETDWNWTIGAVIYLDDLPTENEGLTMVAGIPATSGDTVQVLGVAVSADTIYFNPQLDLTEVP